VDELEQSLKDLTRMVEGLAKTTTDVYPLITANAQVIAHIHATFGGGMDHEVGSLPNQPLPKLKPTNGSSSTPMSSMN
jgi:hypothetical protein